MNVTVDEPVVTAPAPGGSAARRVLAGLVLPAATVVVVVVGIRTPVPGGISALLAVAFGLVLLGAVCGAILARTPQRTALWQVSLGAGVASVALTAARIGDQAAGGLHHTARAVATLAVPILIAIWVHMLLALPDGRLASQGRRIGAGLAYAAAAGLGLVLVIAGRPFPAWAAALAWAADR